MAADLDKVLQAAQKLLAQKQFAQATQLLQRVVAEAPKDIRSLLKVGDYYVQMAQYTSSLETYERVAKLYVAQGSALKAVTVYKRIREIIQKHVPEMADQFGHIVPQLAEIYTQLGLTSDALAAYDEMATRLQRAGRDREAIDVFRKVVALDPQNPLGYLRLADACVRVRDVEKAILNFGSATDILIKLGRRDDALKVLERLLQHRADARFARVAAQIYLERAGPNDAMAALTKLQISFKETPKDLETLGLLARAFDQLGQPAKSIEVQKESARIAKDVGRIEEFEALVDVLVKRAPNDEGVQQLVQARAAAAAESANERATLDGEEVEEDAESEAEPEAAAEEEVDAEVEVESVPGSQVEAPFAMRPSHVPQEPSDPVQRAKQVLAQVEEFRRRRELDQAVALLFESIESLPTARELRERLFEVLLEAGDQEEAIRQMLAFARWLVGAGDTEGAARLLDEVLLLESGQPEAIALLTELGYSVADSFDEPSVIDEPSSRGAAQPASARYDPTAPLPSYDLEEVSASDAMARGPASAAQQPRPQFTTLDTPFGGAPAQGPLPSFPIEDEGARFVPPPAGAREAEAPPAAAPPPGAAQLDEESLEEVEFFASHGMFEEAKNLLDEQLARLPNHPLLLERKRELQNMAGGSAGGSGPRAVPRASEPAADDRSFDIAASLDALDALDSLDAGPEAAVADDPRQVSVESVFEQFKAGVKEHVPASDAATHYDLAFAYRDMMLFPDAITEFELASHDPSRECVCHSMIGTIWMQLGDVQKAIDAYIRGLNSSIKTKEQELFLIYELGDSYEGSGAPDTALYYFQQVARMDATHSDPRGPVTERIRRLESVHSDSSVRVVRQPEAQGDEFDAALDDLLGGGLPGGGKG